MTRETAPEQKANLGMKNFYDKMKTKEGEKRDKEEREEHGRIDMMRQKEKDERGKERKRGKDQYDLERGQ